MCSLFDDVCYQRPLRLQTSKNNNRYTVSACKGCADGGYPCSFAGDSAGAYRTIIDGTIVVVECLELYADHERVDEPMSEEEYAALTRKVNITPLEAPPRPLPVHRLRAEAEADMDVPPLTLPEAEYPAWLRKPYRPNGFFRLLKGGQPSPLRKSRPTVSEYESALAEFAELALTTLLPLEFEVGVEAPTASTAEVTAPITPSAVLSSAATNTPSGVPAAAPTTAPTTAAPPLAQPAPRATPTAPVDILVSDKENAPPRPRGKLSFKDLVSPTTPPRSRQVKRGLEESDAQNRATPVRARWRRLDKTGTRVMNTPLRTSCSANSPSSPGAAELPASPTLATRRVAALPLTGFWKANLS